MSKRWNLRIVWLVVLAAMTLMVAACGRDDEDESASDPGITDETIKLGGSYPFSGPASAYRVVEAGAQARFKTVNAEGGVDGREIEFVTLDDAYEPPKAVQNARRLVQEEKVFALFNPVGTANGVAVWDYVNKEEVPQVYVASGSSIFGADVEAHPWTIGLQPDYTTEAQVYADFLKKEKTGAKVAVLYQNDAFGEEILGAFKAAIKGGDAQIVAAESYEVTDPTISSQMAKLANSGADTFLSVTTPKFAAQAIAAQAKLGWKVLHILNNVSASKALVLAPVGFENAQGIVSTSWLKDPESAEWASDPDVTEYKAALKEYEPKVDPNDPFAAYGWIAASTMVEALKGMEEPTRDALMESVRNMDLEIPLLLPGVKVQTDGTEDGYPVEAMQIVRFEGENWKYEGEVIQAPH